MPHPSYSRLIMLGAAPETRGAIAALAAAYRAHGLFSRWPVEYLPTHGPGGALANARLAAGALARFGAHLARGRCIVHLHLDRRAGLRRGAPFAAAALAARAPLILHLHGSAAEHGRELELARFFFERAACVAVPCEAMRAWVRGVARNAYAVCVPHPVATLPASSAPRPPLVLFLGRLAAPKGIFDLLEALAEVRAAVPEVRLVCAGEGERIAVARYAERLGIADAVKFTGWVGPSGKRALLENAAVCALPSYDEALPVSLVEAMAAGLPVVAAAVGGIPEVALDGVSAFLVAPGDKATLARSLARVLTDPALAARVGAAARESARLRFAPDNALPKLEALYAALGLFAGAELVPG